MMNRIIRYLLIAIVPLTAACSWNSTPDSPEFSEAFTPGTGKVSFTAYAPLKDKPVTIHYYIPEGGNVATMPILFVFPGTNRNASDYLNAWKTNASYKKVIVFALEFPTAYYSSSQYIEGGMFTDGSLNPEDRWSFSIVEPMFDYIKSQLGNRSTTYSLWGHSAGAQFVHRMVMFKKDLRLAKAISSNAGWYTVPDETVDYPYGLKGSPVNSLMAQQALFNKPLIVHLGTADTDPNDSSLNTSEGAMKQGDHRYARGNYFWSETARISSEKGVVHRWLKVEVPGVAHDFARMADDAASLLF